MTAPPALLLLSPASDEALKPSELIRLTGHERLSLNARRAITLLWHSAHVQGVEEGRDYTIELADLRPDGHRGNDRIEEAIVALMQTVLTISLPDGRTRRVQFLGGNDMDDPSRPRGVLTYSLDKRLVQILRDSAIWGRIAIPVLMSFSSKYAVSLYENTSQWIGLKYRSHKDLSLNEFRAMLGVEGKKYGAFGALNKHVVKPAAAEINALAPFGLSIVPIKTGRRVTHVRVGWYRKNEDGLREAQAEAQRSRVGRRARIEGHLAAVSDPVASVAGAARQERQAARRRGDVPNPSLFD